MRKILIAIVSYLSFIAGASAQSNPGWEYGFIPTPAQWNTELASKQDFLGAPPCVTNGCTFIGPVITAPSTALGSGFNIPPGVPATSPINGDIWTTSAGIYVRINGVTIGPLASTTSTVQQQINLNSSPLQSPLTGTILQMGNANGVVSRVELDAYANSGVFSCVRSDGTAAAPTALQANDEICSVNAWGHNGTGFVGGAARISMFAAQTWSVGANGSYIRLGTIANGSAAGTPIDRLSIENDGGLMTFNNGIAPTGGSEGNGSLNLFGPLYNNGTAPTGTGAYVRATSAALFSPSLTTPSLGVATGTSLALGGATIGANALAVTGSTALAATTVTGSFTATGTSAPASAAGNTVVMGTIAAPTLANNGQAFHYNTAVNGAVVQGQGSTYDVSLANNAGTTVFGVITGTTGVQFGGAITAASLSTSGTIAGSLCRTSGGLVLYEVGVNCFTAGAATSIAPGTTTISPTNNGEILYDNSGIIGEKTVASFLSSGNGISITNTTTATISQSLTNVTVMVASLSASNSGSTSLTHAGLGSSCKFTPAYSTRVLLTFGGEAANNTASDAMAYQIRYGTGAAPTSGNAATGTAVGSLIQVGGGAGNANVGFTVADTVVVTGLTVSTAYWFDLTYESIVGGTTSLGGISCAAQEF